MVPQDIGVILGIEEPYIGSDEFGPVIAIPMRTSTCVTCIRIPLHIAEKFALAVMDGLEQAGLAQEPRRGGSRCIER